MRGEAQTGNQGCACSRRLRLAGLLCALGLAAASVWPAESNRGDEPAPGAEPATADAEAPPADIPPEEDVFLPSEEISEDYAVPFPVDI